MDRIGRADSQVYQEECLLEQPYIKDQDMAVKDPIGGADCHHWGEILAYGGLSALSWVKGKYRKREHKVFSFLNSR